MWHLETHAYSKVPCTAPTAQQLRDILWGELSKWRRHADEQSARRGDHPDLYLSTLFHLTQDRLYDLQAPEWAATARTARKEAPEEGNEALVAPHEQARGNSAMVAGQWLAHPRELSCTVPSRKSGVLHSTFWQTWRSPFSLVPPSHGRGPPHLFQGDVT